MRPPSRSTRYVSFGVLHLNLWASSVAQASWLLRPHVAALQSQCHPDHLDMRAMSPRACYTPFIRNSHKGNSFIMNTFFPLAKCLLCLVNTDIRKLAYKKGTKSMSHLKFLISGVYCTIVQESAPYGHTGKKWRVGNLNSVRERTCTLQWKLPIKPLVAAYWSPHLSPCAKAPSLPIHWRRTEHKACAAMH
jgi:hypothetical protein